MNAGVILKNAEKSAVGGISFNTKQIKTFSATIAITLIILGFLVYGFLFMVFSPVAIYSRLIEETDTQRADAVQSSMLVFQQTLYNGDVSSTTEKLLNDNNVQVGYINNEGEFIETSKHDGELVLKMGDKIITARNFINEVNTDRKLYEAFDKAVYVRYYYDEVAREVFKKIGTTRNNYSREGEFEDILGKKLNFSSDINFNTVSLVEEKQINPETGEEEIRYVYQTNGDTVSSKSSDVLNFLDKVREKNPNIDTKEAALNTADFLRIADTVSKEQTSSLFFALFMENVSKMKAGLGSESSINDAMNFLYEKAENTMVDVDTGETIKTYGTPLESPSLYAILFGGKVNPNEVKNYSSDRIWKTISNKINYNNPSITNETVASIDSKIKGTISRLIKSNVTTASPETIYPVQETVENSLMKDSYKSIEGLYGGELLVDGAINVYRKLAKSSGATPGDTEAVAKYARMNAAVLAMDQQVDRMNRSPFDITSKNTFLGSILYNFAVSSLRSSKSFLSGLKILSSTTIKSVASLIPSSYADSVEGYLSSHGDCVATKTTLAVESVNCLEIAVYDTSTLNDPFNNTEFQQFVEENTYLDSSGARVVKDNSFLATFIKYNNKNTPLGTIDGGILDSIKNQSNSIPFVTDFLSMIEELVNASETDKRIASGAAFVNSTMNPEWQTYKYAQRYVALARATEVERTGSGDDTAYNKIKFFEGTKNPVTAFLEKHSVLAEQNQ